VLISISEAAVHDQLPREALARGESTRPFDTAGKLMSNPGPVATGPTKHRTSDAAAQSIASPTPMSLRADTQEADLIASSQELFALGLLPNLRYTNDSPVINRTSEISSACRQKVPSLLNCSS